MLHKSLTIGFSLLGAIHYQEFCLGACWIDFFLGACRIDFFLGAHLKVVMDGTQPKVCSDDPVKTLLADSVYYKKGSNSCPVKA